LNPLESKAIARYGTYSTAGVNAFNELVELCKIRRELEAVHSPEEWVPWRRLATKTIKRNGLDKAPLPIWRKEERDGMAWRLFGRAMGIAWLIALSPGAVHSVLNDLLNAIECHEAWTFLTIARMIDAPTYWKNRDRHTPPAAPSQASPKSTLPVPSADKPGEIVAEMALEQLFERRRGARITLHTVEEVRRRCDEAGCPVSDRTVRRLVHDMGLALRGRGRPKKSGSS